MPLQSHKATIVLPDFARSELRLSEPEFMEFWNFQNEDKNKGKVANKKRVKA